MTTTKRYIVGHRFGPQIDPQSAKSLDTFVAKNESARSVRQTQVGRRVVEMTEAQMRDFQRSNPSLVIEEDQPLQLFAMPGLPGRVPIEGPFSLPVSVADAANGTPLSNVTIYGLGTDVTYKAVTDGKGKATLETREQRLRNIVASPRDGYWSLVSPEIQIAAKTTLSLTLKPLWTTGAYDWGHRLMGFHQVHRSWSGKEIRIGVVDFRNQLDQRRHNPRGWLQRLGRRQPRGCGMSTKRAMALT